MIDLTKTKLLVIAPHLDDEVIGCAGLIQRVKEAGGTVHVLFLCVGDTQDFSAKGASSVTERTHEAEAVAQLLGFDGWRIAFPGNDYHLRLDHVPQRDIIHAIEAGEEISLQSLRPTICAFPAFGDYNQDHRAAAAAALAACRSAPPEEKHVPGLVLSYEAPMGSWMHPAAMHQPNFFIQLRDEHAQKKITAMELYASQARAAGHPRHTATLDALARLRGSAIGTTYAEAYYSHRIHI